MRALLWLGATALTLLAGCAAAPPAVDDRVPLTASDQTDADRRAKVRIELASLYFARGQGTTALDEVKRALASKPDMSEAFSLRGLIYASLGQPELAEESFKRALQLAPQDGDVMHNFGWFLCQQKRYPESDAQFRNALLQPRYQDVGRTLLTQGICQARAGQWAEAERTLLRSYELDPSSPVTAYNLSEVLMHRGDLERARFYVARINAVREQATEQSLWLATRIEHKLGNSAAEQTLGRQLRDRFPQSAEALKFERGRFDE